MIIYIILGIAYYVLSSLLFLKLSEDETIFCLDWFDIVMCLMPIIRFIYYIYLKCI